MPSREAAQAGAAFVDGRHKPQRVLGRDPAWRRSEMTAWMVRGGSAARSAACRAAAQVISHPTRGNEATRGIVEGFTWRGACRGAPAPGAAAYTMPSRAATFASNAASAARPWAAAAAQESGSMFSSQVGRPFHASATPLHAVPPAAAFVIGRAAAALVGNTIKLRIFNRVYRAAYGATSERFRTGARHFVLG